MPTQIAGCQSQRGRQLQRLGKVPSIQRTPRRQRQQRIPQNRPFAAATQAEFDAHSGVAVHGLFFALTACVAVQLIDHSSAGANDSPNNFAGSQGLGEGGDAAGSITAVAGEFVAAHSAVGIKHSAGAVAAGPAPGLGLAQGDVAEVAAFA